MEEKNQTRAIDQLIAHIPRLKAEFWETHGKSYNDQLTGLSGSERRVYDVARSIWNGDAQIDLYDTLCSFNDELFESFVDALRIARTGH